MCLPNEHTRSIFPTLLLAACCSLACLHLSASEQITIHGRLLAQEARFNDALLVVEVEHVACLWSELDADGRFTFRVPVDSHVRLVFIKPGYLTKEVLVDTRNALVNPRAERLNHRVEFDVVMLPVEEHVHEVYLGPVGYITFVRGSGLMAVRFDGRMRPVPTLAEEMPGPH